MPIKTDRIGQAPYFDDFDEEKKFHRILFRPGIPVQARELTQLQTILQNQIERFGQHVFEEGAMVIPGYANFNSRVDFVRVVNEPFHTEEWLKNNVHNNEFVSPTGKKALVLTSLLPFGTETATLLYIQYLSGDGNLDDPEFVGNEILTNNATGIQFTTVSSNHKGKGTLGNIDRGVYFLHGHFVLVDEQVVVVDPFSQTSSKRIGLQVFEEIIRPEDDESLKDNAQGSPNFAAPGAHRLAIYADLVVKDLSTIGDAEVEENFIELIRLRNGIVEQKVDVTDYSILERTLARRTNDQSGSFTVKPFLLNIVDHPSDSEKLIAEISPGVAYVEGYEIRTIAKNTVEIEKARETKFSNNAIIDTNFGNFVRVTDLYGMPNFNEFTVVNLYEDPNIPRGVDPSTLSLSPIGTARVRGIEYQSGVESGINTIYRLYLFDIQTNPGKKFENVKYMYANNGSYGVFTCRTRQVSIPMQGTIREKSGSTINGIGTSWLQGRNRLREGDWIFIGGGLNRFVRIAQNPVGGQSIEIDDTFSDFSGEDYPFSIVYSELEGTDRNSLLFFMPNGPVETIRGITKTDPDVDTSYTIRRQFDQEEVSANQVILNTSSPNEQFVSFSPSDYLITIFSGTYNPGSGVQGVGSVINPLNLTFTLSSQQVTINFPGTASGDLRVNVVASVTKIQGLASKEKTKQLVNHTANYGNLNNTNLSTVILNVCDVFRLNKVYMSNDFNTNATSSDVDITERYDLDSGQRDNFYDRGRLILKQGSQKPTGRILVDCEYFQHGGNGNYFSVDSYDIPYEEIPTYISNETGTKYELRDCLDFRPRLNTAGTAFTGTEASLTELPKTVTRADYHFYLNRIDKLFLTRDGRFKIKKGISEILPKTPSDPDEGMTLYKLNLRAYTFEPKDVVQEFVENKRYTMRDIGKLERRIENIEYYTSLTMLEKETRDLLITDSDGLDRFKNGFLVDPFSGHGVGDVSSQEYRCSIDFQERECRPLFVQDNVNLIEFKPAELIDVYNEIDVEYEINDVPGQLATINSQPVLHSSYQITGDHVTLPYDEELMVSQPYATNSVNVNPFAVFNFWGQIDLNPANDEWKDTRRLPDQIINQEGNFDSMVSVAEAAGTIWNEWETQWTSTASRAEPLAHIMEVAQVEMQHVDNLGNPDGNFTNRRRDGTLEPWPVRHTFISRIITESASLQRREGVRFEVVPRTVTQSLGDRVVDVSYLPFMRTREVQFRAFGMMPNTRVYAFFDDVDVNQYCSPWLNPAIPEGFDLSKAGDPLITDVTGSVSGTFKIPNRGGEKQFGDISFKTGQKVFRLTNRANNDNQFQTVANATYTAQGILETVQETIVNTRNADLQRSVVFEDRVVTDRREDIDVQQGPWVDPIAMTFIAPTPGGAFIPSLDIFVEKKDSNIPLRVQIREVVNGYPSLNVVPFGDITIPANEVNTNEIINGELFINGVVQLGAPTSDKFLATNVKFTQGLPYLKRNTEYAIVVLANSNNYTCWVATVGQNDPATNIVYKMVGTDIPMTDQPYAGSFFKSQNSSTWTADQYVNLMFNVYQCKFETNVDGIFIACNDPRDIQGFDVLNTNPIQTKEGSNKIRIHHLNHGHVKTDPELLVSITGVQSSVNGIPASDINGNHRVLEADLYSYVIQVNSNATITGFGGGSNIVASKCRQMDVVHPIVGQIVLPDTNLSCSIRATNKRTIHDSLGLNLRNLMDDTSEYVSLIENENFTFFNPRQVLSSVNEVYNSSNRPFYPVNATLNPSPSVFFRCVLSTTNENVSPVIDLNRLSLVTIGNKIDNPSGNPYNTNRSINFEGIDDEDILSFVDPAEITFDGNTITATNDAEAIALSNIDAGKIIEIKNFNSNKNGLYEVRSVEFDSDNVECTINLVESMNGGSETGTATTEIVQWNNFISEAIPERGKLTSKYLTRRVLLSASSTALRVSFGAMRPFNNQIKLYYKISPVDESQRFEDLPWVEAQFDHLPSESTAHFNFKEYVATINNLPEFNIFAIKIGFIGERSTQVPRIIDLRTIALDE